MMAGYLFEVVDNGKTYVCIAEKPLNVTPDVMLSGQFFVVDPDTVYRSDNFPVKL